MDPGMLISKPCQRVKVAMKTLSIILALFSAALGVRGQALEDVIYTVGTTTKDAAARNWAYLVWQGTTPDLIQNKHFAIYSKAGDATSANPLLRQSITGVQTEPTVIQAVLNRAVNLGDNLEQLETRI